MQASRHNFVFFAELEAVPVLRKGKSVKIGKAARARGGEAQLDRAQASTHHWMCSA